ncbi:MAG TPA: aldehyde dehydrogenase family protein [Thermoanaerobaculia bacterium]|nr:aldehyde dehydrogenase family protein [Thermoanaerobaculia bacterium]
MMRIPVLRWGKPYESLETDTVVHFETGEELAVVDQANPGLIQRDLRRISLAREALRAIPSRELIGMVRAAADLYMSAELPMGDGVQRPEDFVRIQSATTGLPEHMCRANMEKNHFVLTRMDEVLDALTRGLDLGILGRGYGVEERGVPVSYQAQAAALGLVLPSNSPGVHTLWMPVIPLQVGLVFKPGPQEPWTPYRMTEAFYAAGVPREAISIYPGGAEAGAAVLAASPRALIFGGKETVDRYRGNPRVQPHGPGFSKILLGDDCVDEWEHWLDVMVSSVAVNSGRSCISCSGIWASRHTREIAEAVAERLAPIAPKPMTDPDSPLAAFTVPGVARTISGMIDRQLEAPGVEDVTQRLRGGESRLVERERCDFLRPTVVHSVSPEPEIANVEYMFPFVSVVECPQDRMIDSIGDTLVCSAITSDPGFRARLIDATNVDRLNLGPVPTIQLNWLQPHEGNIIDFLFRARAFQESPIA